MKTLSILFIAFLFFKYISFGQDGWLQLASETVEKLNSIYFIDDNNDFIDCASGKVLRTTNGGISFVVEQKSSELSADYYLRNNFSNPFNPTEKIKYSVSQSANLIIKIFDVLSNEIETLISEKNQLVLMKFPGILRFYTANVTFIKAGCFVETK